MLKYIKIEKLGILDNYIIDEVDYLKREISYTNLKENYNDIRVRIRGVCYSFRITQHELFSLNRTTKFLELSPCSIFEDVNSEYLKDHQNRTKNVNCNIKHYIIVSGEDIVDVLSDEVPLIERIE